VAGKLVLGFHPIPMVPTTSKTVSKNELFTQPVIRASSSWGASGGRVLRVNQNFGVNAVSVGLYPAIGMLEGQWPVAPDGGVVRPTTSSE
jgi:hypothetical protein